MRMSAKQLGERVAVVEKELAEAAARARAEREERANMPMMAVAPMAENCAKEVLPRQPSKAERRGKLIAAHVALAAIRHDLGDYSEYEAINRTQTSICAAIGRLELRD